MKVYTYILVTLQVSNAIVALLTIACISPADAAPLKGELKTPPSRLETKINIIHRNPHPKGAAVTIVKFLSCKLSF